MSDAANAARQERLEAARQDRLEARAVCDDLISKMSAIQGEWEVAETRHQLAREALKQAERVVAAHEAPNMTMSPAFVDWFASQHEEWEWANQTCARVQPHEVSRMQSPVAHVLGYVFGDSRHVLNYTIPITQWLVAKGGQFRSGTADRASLRIPVTGLPANTDVMFESGRPWAEGPICIWVNLWMAQRAREQLIHNRVRR